MSRTRIGPGRAPRLAAIALARGRAWPVVVLALVAGCGEAPVPSEQAAVEVPRADTGAMEPQVAARIETAREEVLAAPERAERWGRLGMVYQAHALWAQAASCYRRAESLEPADYRWPYLTALAMTRSGDAALLDAFDRAAALGPDNPAFYINFGNALAESGEPELAEVRFRTALELDPASSHALYGLAGAELARGDLEAAREHLERAAEIAPRHGEVHSRLAQVYHRLGETERARRREMLARAHPDPSRAPDPVLLAVEAEAVSSRAHTRRGLALAAAGSFAEAEAEFRRVLEIRPGNARDFANLGGALARQGKLDEAIGSYERALAIDPDDPATLNNLAMAEADRGRLDAAVSRLEQALAVDPTYAEAHQNLGLVASRAGRAGEAEDHYRRALQLNPGLKDAHTNLGALQASSGRMDEAVAQWRLALDIDPGDLSALYNLALALAARGEHSRSIARLRQGLAIAPNSSRLVALLAWELATAPDPALRDGRQALDLARRVAEAYPGEPRAVDTLAAALAETGDFAAAARAAERALALASGGGQQQLARQIQARLDLYTAGRAFRQPGPG